MQSMTSLNRRKLLSDKDLWMKKKTPFKQKADRLRQDVVDFLSRDSRILPGQTDAVKVGKGKKNKQVLIIYTTYHLKYKAESKISILI